MSIETVLNESCIESICGYVLGWICCGCCMEEKAPSPVIPNDVTQVNSFPATIRTAKLIPLGFPDEPHPTPVTMTPSVHNSRSNESIPTLIRIHT